MKKWSVYIVRCIDGTLYTGIALDILRRIKAHNAGKGARYTSGRGPVTLVWQALNLTSRLARRRELEIKRLTREAKERLIRGR